MAERRKPRVLCAAAISQIHRGFSVITGEFSFWALAILWYGSISWFNRFVPALPA